MRDPRGLTAVVVALCAPLAHAQQFVEQSTTRFPQPDPLEYSNQLTIGDLDNDGDLDIVWANGGNYSSPGPNQLARIFINNGSGVFTDESLARGAASGVFRGVELGDIDRDGDLDMILASDFNRLPALLVNNGAGVFTDVTATQLPQNTLGSTRGQFADLDNDGDLDLYLTNGGGNRFGAAQGQVYLNNGAGFFSDATATNITAAVIAEPMDAIFADIDGDFDLDLCVGSTGAIQSRLYRNDGTGFLAMIPGAITDRNCYSYDFGDVEGDGDLDLIGANASPVSTNGELLLINDGAGVFADLSGVIQPNPAVDDNDSKFFDFDNDGDLDLIVARLGGTAERIYRNNGGSFAQSDGMITSVSDSSLDIMVADLDNDGDLDIVTAQGESGSFRNRIYMNTIGPADTIAPRIIALEQHADTADLAGPYVVRAAVLDGMSSDRNFFARSIRLDYTVNGGAVQTIDMPHSGGQIYRAAIPGQGCGGLVAYRVVATDWAGNVATGVFSSFTIDGPELTGDLNGDNNVGFADLNLLLGVYGQPSATGDVDGDGDTDFADLNLLLGNYGESCV